MLTALRCVLDWQRGTAVIHFEGKTVHLSMDSDTFEDMGTPERITVTVQPGDLLNSKEEVDG